MSGGRMPNCPASVFKGFSSTPVKSSQRQDFFTPHPLDNGVLSDDEDAFSLLTPIYHDSDEELEFSASQSTSPFPSDKYRASVSPDSCELPKSHSEQIVNASENPSSLPSLDAWEMWLVKKAKEDRLRLQKKAEEARLLKETKAQEERQREQKKIVTEKKFQQWLRMKREQEKQTQLVRQSKAEEEMHRQQRKQKETEQKAQQKYKNWLQKKNNEKLEAEKKEKEEAALKEEQKREHRKRAEEKFKEWLTKANEKSKASPQTPCSPSSSYDKSYPSPSFYNPIPWTPICIPPPEKPKDQTRSRKPQKQQRHQQRVNTAFRLRNSGQWVQRR